MKIEQKKEFQPVTITLETEEELAEFYLAVDKVTQENKTISDVFYYLFNKGFMSARKANEILNVQS